MRRDAYETKFMKRKKKKTRCESFSFISRNLLDFLLSFQLYDSFGFVERCYEMIPFSFRCESIPERNSCNTVNNDVMQYYFFSLSTKMRNNGASIDDNK